MQYYITYRNEDGRQFIMNPINLSASNCRQEAFVFHSEETAQDAVERLIAMGRFQVEARLVVLVSNTVT